MQKTEAEKALRNKGYKITEKDNILYFSDASIEDAKAAVAEIGYNESWGIKENLDNFAVNEEEIGEETEESGE